MRVSEDNASIKSLKTVSWKQDEEELTSSLEVLQALESPLETTDVKHEGQGFLLYHNKIFVTPQSTKSVNGIDTTGICEELLAGETVSIKCLVFLNFSVRG
jgi:hypothetical protein